MHAVLFCLQGGAGETESEQEAGRMETADICPRFNFRTGETMKNKHICLGWQVLAILPPAVQSGMLGWTGECGHGSHGSGSECKYGYSELGRGS